MFKNFQRCVLFAVLGLVVPALVGCDKLAPLKAAKAKLEKLKEAKQEATPAAPIAPASTPVSPAAPAVQAAAKPEVEQFSKGWLPPGMSRGEVKQPQSNQRPQTPQKP